MLLVPFHLLVSFSHRVKQRSCDLVVLRVCTYNISRSFNSRIEASSMQVNTLSSSNLWKKQYLVISGSIVQHGSISRISKANLISFGLDAESLMSQITFLRSDSTNARPMCQEMCE